MLKFLLFHENKLKLKKHTKEYEISYKETNLSQWTKSLKKQSIGVVLTVF